MRCVDLKEGALRSSEMLELLTQRSSFTSQETGIFTNTAVTTSNLVVRFSQL
jgi:hypothetical protein